MMRIQAESWYEMKLSSCTNGELLLGNDNVFHLCVYLLFMWISLTLIYAVAVFFRISVKTMDRRSYWSGSNVFSRIYGLCYAESEAASRWDA